MSEQDSRRDAERREVHVDAVKADGRIYALWVIGVFALLGGGIVAGLTLPGEEAGFGTSTVSTGSVGGFAVGLALLGVGQVLLLVAAVASGVGLGIRATRRA